MGSPNTATSLLSRSPDALLSFTATTANTLLPCSKQRLLTHQSLPPLPQFVSSVFAKHRLPPSVMLISLIYLHRLKTRLPRQARGDFDTPYKLFLAAILVASKFGAECGTGLTSVQVARMTEGLYSAREICLMERSFLGLIGYELWVDVEEVKTFLDRFGERIEMEVQEVVVEQGCRWWEDGCEWAL
ncbi:cyclin domain-containing protein [Jimgerdemannia flammicorona]|uniref:Cyclin domain-containing protein n=1 Tax=Jimgerdemannia flammicorona TaxID=994334 RepID=A0A433QJC5_9FUNG|nr:cyclin domain-containing protein [Jimgerdemannia flammicorona]